MPEKDRPTDRISGILKDAELAAAATRDAITFLQRNGRIARVEVLTARHRPDKTLFLSTAGPVKPEQMRSIVLAQHFNNTGSLPERNAKFQVLANWLDEQFTGGESDRPRLKRTALIAEDIQTSITWETSTTDSD